MAKKQATPRLSDGSAALTEEQKEELISLHESDVPAQDLAEFYNISVRSVAAYVANAHRS